MKAGQIVEYCVILVSLAGILLAALEAWKKYLEKEVEKAKQQSSESSAMIAMDKRMSMIEEKLEKVEENEERYLNLLEKLANRSM